MSDNDNTLEQNFNDAELQDIMNEIESLEKEFVEQEASEESSAQAETDIVQAEEPETIEAASEEDMTHEAETEVEASEDFEETPELEASQEDFQEDDFQEEDFQEEAHAESDTDNVVSMEGHRTQASATSTSDSSSAGEMTFSGQGQMDFNMSFTLGEKQATLSVEDGKLKVSVAGVELHLSEEGCEVEMAGGVHFSVPLDSSTNSAGKKAA